MLVLLMVKASEQGRPAVAAFFAVPTLVGLAIAALLVRTMRPVTLTASALRIPSSGFKTVVIPLDDVASVGLVYHNFTAPGQGDAWHAYVWRRNGSVQRINGLRCRKNAYAPWSQIAATRAAKTVRRLDAKIRTMQGPADSLATLELQKHAPTGLTDDLVRLWSPDGYTGDIDSSRDQ